MLRITNFRVPLTDETPLEELAARRLGLPRGAVQNVVIVRRAIDARRKSNISFVYTLDAAVDAAEGQVLARLGGDRDVVLQVREQPAPLVCGTASLEHQPVVVGAGPAGLFAALTLAEKDRKSVV